MVSKLEIGSRLRGALNYNENKVRNGKASLLYAGNYLKDANALSFNNKLNRLVYLADRNERTRKNCIHISLNFDPSEVISNDRMTAIANAYMTKIGFGDQPYLVYRHDDSAHPHMHIVTTNIKSDGKRIPLHNIGRNQSEQARKELEVEFGLVKAEEKTVRQEIALPSSWDKPFYGKIETKAVISNIVRMVVGEYKYSSFPELNAILSKFNITAYKGEPGSKMYANRGLTYSFLDKGGNRTGIPIKASSIYTGPTLNKIERNFEENEKYKLSFKESIKKSIDNVCSSSDVVDMQSFKDALSEEGIDVIFHENNQLIYGITYVDHKNKLVYKGSDLGKEFGAGKLLERVGRKKISDQLRISENQKFAQKIIKEADYNKGIYPSIANWYAKGLRIEPVVTPIGYTEFYTGIANNPSYLYSKLDGKYEKWLRLNGVNPSLFKVLNSECERTQTSTTNQN